MRPQPILASARPVTLSPADIDRLLSECRPSAIAVLLAIGTVRERQQSVAQIASKTGFDRKTVHRALLELKAAKLLVVGQVPGEPSVYRRVSR